ncbi:cobalt uptake protein with substrate-specific transmembrane region [Pacificibacter maritimus]|uniref:Cobalt uptake protein with substrate-specific transmembrane region n=1 Tax=Pacificibacter maritimus TaxID=762213 RepID=A0A3N4UMV4_9RHOB|nr:energy-coupling factor ABC transporter permease [Pacificibacter maritimus]RPE63190.1 cobalt uptake protein with substrate-specific transmembrane region [Pacificibacter maritimus]
MHIEPGLVTGAKIVLSVITAGGAAAFTAKHAWETIRTSGVPAFAVRTALATIAVFIFFQVLPHHAVGVSEVHFIFGSTLLLILGAAPAAIGLALGLLVQGLMFAQIDLPQYGMNVTTLLVPLFAMKMVADRIIAPNTAYADVSYKQALALSTTYQAGVVAWVGFWVTYGQGFGGEVLASVGTFGAAYLIVIAAEPLLDLAVLAGAKALKKPLQDTGIATPRLFDAA